LLVGLGEGRRGKVEGDAFGFVMDELEDYDLSGVGKGEPETAIIRDT